MKGIKFKIQSSLTIDFHRKLKQKANFKWKRGERAEKYTRKIMRREMSKSKLRKKIHYYPYYKLNFSFLFKFRYQNHNQKN